MKQSHTKGIPTREYLSATFAVLLSLFSATARAEPVDVDLGESFSFGILAGSTVTNTGPSVVFRHVGVSTGTAITGFLPGVMVDCDGHLNDSVAQQAQTDLGAAYDAVVNQAADANLTGQNLGGLTLGEGVYRFNNSAQLTGTLLLDAMGDPNARFHFQIGSTLTTASNSFVTVINGGSVDNVFFQVGSSATLGTDTRFEGNILAFTSITLTTGASVPGGRVLARNGAVTLDSNIVGAAAVVIPESSTAGLLICAGLPITFALLRRRRQGK